MGSDRSLMASQTEKCQHKRMINLTKPQIDIISGITAGIISNIVSYPLDTVKVRIQLSKRVDNAKVL